MENTGNSRSWSSVQPSGRMLRPAEVAERVGLSKSQIYEMISDGRFPPFIKLSQRASGMPEAWLNEFIEQLAEQSLSTEVK